MNNFVAFLRGINVGGNTRLNMAELVAMTTNCGYTEVKTYLNSGNLFFQSPEPNASHHQKVLEEAITKRFGLKIRLILKTKAELEVIREANPFKNEIITEERTLFVSFLFEELSSEKQKWLGTLSNPEEQITPSSHEVYTLLVRAYFPKSQMSKNTLLKQGKVDSTTRNWNTLNAVIAKM